MRKINICLVLFVLFQVSFQYCHYSIQNNNGQCNCFGGFYANSANCLVCPNNGLSLGGSISISDCKYCNSNSYYLDQAATDSQGSVCLLCPNNSQTQTNYPQGPQDISDCNICQPGYYLQTPAVPPQNGNPGQAAVCVPCPNNTTSKMGPNPTSISQCDSCQNGFYISQQATDSQPAICSPCPINTTNSYDEPSNFQYNINDCTSCMPGYYNSNQNFNQPPMCVQCPPNTFNYITGSFSISTCTCMENSYMTVQSTNNSAPTCLPCPNGSGNYQPPLLAGDQSQCDICQAGYYASTPYADPTNGNPGIASQCHQCPNNSYSDPGLSFYESSCYKCKLNYYMKTAPALGVSAICQLCPNNSGTLNPITEQGDETQCSICTDGYYMTQAFQIGKTASCQKCPPGSTSKQGINTGCYCFDQNATWSSNTNSCQCNQGYFGTPATSIGAQGCTPCPAGQYYQSGNCVDCQAGYYSSSPASLSCTLCTTGKYAQGTGNTSCASCPDKSTSSLDFSSCLCFDSSAIFKNNICVCPDGYFGTPNSSSQPGCSPCSKGQYSNSSTSGACTVCPAGYFAASIGSSQCQQCSDGQFASGTGNSSCQTCGSSKTNNSDFTDCQCIDPNSNLNGGSCICNPGYIGTPATSIGAQGCTPCPAGKYYQSGNCVDCQAGYYSSSPASLSCTQCTAGNYAQGTGNTSCASCPNKTTSSVDFSGCQCIDSSAIFKNNICVCPDGYFGTPNSSSQPGCSPCSKGQYSNSSTSGACTVCPAGYFAASIGSSQCQQCSHGQFASGTGNSSCQTCGSGKTNNSDFTDCQCIDPNSKLNGGSCICIPGYIGTPATSIGAQGCTPCPAGKYYQSGSCVDCQAGYYSSSPASLSCTQCITGKYAQGTGNTSCASCPNKTTSSVDFSGCQCIDSSAIFKNNICVCPDGYFGTPNSSSQPGCSPCSKGQYSNSSTSGACTVCPAGYFAASIGSSQCQQCSHGQFASGTGNSSCQTCGSGKTNNSDFTDCQCIDPNSKLNGGSCICNSGYIGTPATSISAQGCTPCPAGKYYQSGNCVDCQAGHYSSSPASLSCTQCTTGKYAQGTGNTSCTSCPNNTTPLADFSGCQCIDSSAIFKNNNCVCPDGYFGTPNSSSQPGCSPCSKGQYSNSSTSGACTACPAGYFTASIGSSQCQQCSDGQFASGTGNSSCQTCGSSKTNNNDFTDCQCIDHNSKLNGGSCICNPGYIGTPATSKNSSNSCTACPAGQFTDLSSGKCSPCPAGTFSNGQANVNCTQCSSGQYANGTGNTSCSNCGPGSTNTDDFSGCKCYDSNAVVWSADKNQCQCAANFYGDASLATSVSKTQCINCPNNTTSKIGAAKTQKDCQNISSSTSTSSSQSQQIGQYSFSQIIKISIILALVLLI
ncbi:GCC2 and GCC3 family protein (macronuclear) [Tetrahymena thermophila SB210]|uniref:GCC2 and GCC3 family protein n=1 Tax=Tetrahymena thermophila (strain SB210) TaxID=312017 RepID=Q22E89_TETTS|nr:GCC2 and GCC3 family protein [Tetrahymena thermophila SB210]EAR83639.1 GCC2 and GCC3 family protein [Tetrahymena thermophila SB210]|eukprot:XP_001031302.1 GCC2 and GCC3 family protein [Tetrahymena thermophila SB210]